MKSIVWLATVMSLSLTASGAVVTYNDIYHGQTPGTTLGSSVGDGDVIGLLRDYDIQKAVLTTSGNNVTIQLYTNYHNGDTSLGPITDPFFPTVNPGDIMMAYGGNLYAIPIVSHNNATPAAPGPGVLTAGSLYLMDLNALPFPFLSAFNILNNGCDVCYRPTQSVWGNPSGATLVTSGTVGVSAIAGAQILITLNLSDAALASAISSDPGFFFEYTSATCGNDVLDGIGQGDPVADTPEPVSFVLMSGGLMGLALLRRRISRN